MLAIAKRQMLHGHEVFADTNDAKTYYVIPKEPRFRLDEHGKPVFKFVKYRFPVERPDGKKGGGYVFFDVAFYVAQETLDKIKATLEGQLTIPGEPPPEITLAAPAYTRGKANFLLKNEDGSLIQSVMGVTEPSGYGENTAAYAIELTPEGAALFEKTMKGAGVGGVIVQYELSILAALPPLTAHAWFHGREFSSFFQQVDIDERLWADDSYRETIRERAYSSETTGVTVDMQYVLPEGPEATSKLRESIRTSMRKSLEEAVARKALKAIDPVAADQRELPEGDFEHVIRNFETARDVFIDEVYTENAATEWTIKPDGNIPNITTMLGPDGKPFKWEDYSEEIDLNHPFYKQLNVAIGVNADFENLPLHSVEVHLDYKEGQTHQIGEYEFDDPDERQKFATYIENDNWSYDWWYEVNYKGADKTFKSEKKTTDEKILTVNVSDLGILHAAFEAGAVDWTQVAAAQIAFEYTGSNGRVGETLTLTEGKPTANFVKPIFEPRDRPFGYTIAYQMADGREFTSGPHESIRERVVVNDVFQTRTIPIRVAGDLSFEDGDDPSEVIDEILLDVVYGDADGLSQSTNIALSAEQPFLDWKIPVVGDGGQVKYSGQIKYHDSTIVPIPETIAPQPTIVVGDVVATRAKVTVVADLLDFTQIKLAKVTVTHGDEVESFMFKPNGATEATFELDAAERGPISYHWEALYYLGSGTRRAAGDTTDELLVLELPPADSPAPAPPVG